MNKVPLLKMIFTITFWVTCLPALMHAQCDWPINGSYKSTTIKSHEIIQYDNNNKDHFVVQYFINNGKGLNKYASILEPAVEYLKLITFKNIKFNLKVDNNWIIITAGDQINNFADNLAHIDSFFNHLDIAESDFLLMKRMLIDARESDLNYPEKIAEALVSYARFGPNNPFNYTISQEELNALTLEGFKEILTNSIHAEHKIALYAPEIRDLKKTFLKHHPVLKKKVTKKTSQPFKPIELMQNKVIVVGDERIKAPQLFWIKNNHKPNTSDELKHLLYADTLFTTHIAQQLASAFAEDMDSVNSSITLSNYSDQFLFTANHIYLNKNVKAIDPIISYTLHLLNNIKIKSEEFENVRLDILKNMMESNNSFAFINNNCQNALHIKNKLGNHEDYYKFLQTVSLVDVQSFFTKNISIKPYTLCIVMNEINDFKYEAMKYGVTTTITLNELFGY